MLAKLVSFLRGERPTIGACFRLWLPKGPRNSYGALPGDGLPFICPNRRRPTDCGRFGVGAGPFSPLKFVDSMTSILKSERLPTKPRDCWSKCFCSALVFLLCLTAIAVAAQSQPAPATPAQSAPAAQDNSDQSAAEIVSHDEATTFKVNVKLVLVRVVVRDSQGHAIGTLHKEDFQLFDNRKPQIITHFVLERPGSQVAKERQTSNENGVDKLPSVPERYIAFVFDDIHLTFGDMVQARTAAEHHFATLQPTDRAAIFSTSGQTMLDFTDDRAKLHDALLRLQPRPIARTGTTNCPDISYYMADLIQNKNDTQAFQAAVQDAVTCLGLSGSAPQQQGAALQAAEGAVQAEISQQLEQGSQESRVALSVLKDVVRRISIMPGQRSMVVVSPGFLTPETNMFQDYSDVIDRALRSEVIISTLDARGLYTIVPGGDISKPGSTNAFSAGVET